MPKADPLLAFLNSSGELCVPLDAAVDEEHSEVVHALIQGYGIEGCGGATGGGSALCFVAESQQLEVMGVLTNAGVVDTGAALVVAGGRESSLKLLLQQWKQNTSGDGDGYLDTLAHCGETPFLGVWY